jgi:hypothetical protein
MTSLAFVAILVVYGVAAVGVTYAVVRLSSTPARKWLVGLASGFLFLGFAIWDEVSGYAQLRQLCAAEAGIRVYNRVPVKEDGWNADGSPRFISFDGESFFKPFFDGRYQIKSSGITVSGWPEIVRVEDAVVDLRTNSRLAARVNFLAGRGWILQMPGWQVNRRSCANADAGWGRALINSAFVKSPS